MKKLFLAALFSLTSACAFTPQTVQLKPEVQINAAALGRGREISLVTVDERTRSVVGNRAVAGFGANITTEQDIAAIINTSIMDGLKKKGFAVKTATKPGEARELRVEVRNLEYTVTQGLFTGTMRTEAALKALCTINKNREYERLYRAETSESIIVIQFAETNEKRINESLSKAIQGMLDDNQLLSCLAQ